jgi:hypothetical protein
VTQAGARKLPQLLQNRLDTEIGAPHLSQASIKLAPQFLQLRLAGEFEAPHARHSIKNRSKSANTRR